MPTVPRRRAESVLSALGVSAADERRYQQILPLTGGSAANIASALGVHRAELEDALAGLLDRGIVSIDQGRVTVLRAAQVVSAAIAREATAAIRTQARLDDLARAVPLLAATGTRPGPGELEDLGSLDGELSAGGDPLALLSALIEGTTGDLLFLRPDAWMMPREAAMARVVGRAVASGRRSRAVYPLRVMHEAADILRARVGEGEEVRLIDDLPTRLMIIHPTHAIVPEPLGYADEPRLLVRQGALVAALTLLFELYWERAVPVTDLSGTPAGERTFLLHQLQVGARDEQIARAMGLSLRTVRRRISQLMIELGADTRFQAGAEAARRGWLESS